MRHHQVAVHVHAELARQADVLDRDVGLGAVSRDPDQVGAELGCSPELALGADSRLERDGQPGPLDRAPGRGQQFFVGMQGAHVLDR